MKLESPQNVFLFLVLALGLGGFLSAGLYPVGATPSQRSPAPETALERNGPAVDLEPLAEGSAQGEFAEGDEGSAQGERVEAAAVDEPVAVIPEPAVAAVPEIDLPEESPDAVALLGDDPSLPWAVQRTGSRREPCAVVANRLVIATGINRREPTGERGPFLANGEPIIAFAEIENMARLATDLGVVWTHAATGTREVSVIQVGNGSRWRTWAERPLPLSRLGEWQVQVVDPEGCLLASERFQLRAESW